MSWGRHCDLHGKGQDVPVFDNKVRQVKPLFVCFSLNTLPFYGPVWMFWIFPEVIKRLCLLSVPTLCNVVEVSFITCSFSSLKKVKGILKKEEINYSSLYICIRIDLWKQTTYTVTNDKQIQLAFTFEKCLQKFRCVLSIKFFFLIAVLKS